ncbi:hypothetical protein RM543_08355 [Roseicyclus sp. F158]|uniref:Uncharacterized protein n=1 Tax=Tropicimonas omnivorans TaxID=3075590 RepID=A0ABU3DG73_9RHOB|nr:hypothetical protein [Roseicyclus sp. F158]MDT0682695.1 hypothetical protein [Roseicyclus sp. F158]
MSVRLAALAAILGILTGPAARGETADAPLELARGLSACYGLYAAHVILLQQTGQEIERGAWMRLKPVEERLHAVMPVARQSGFTLKEASAIAKATRGAALSHLHRLLDDPAHRASSRWLMEHGRACNARLTDD